jgi:hypothetical protein
MINLVGVNHSVQYVGRFTDPAELQAFYRELEKQCIGRKAELTAEELNQEQLDESSEPTQKSVCCQVAKKLNIKHIFCNPTKAQYKQNGYKQENEIAMKLWQKDMSGKAGSDFEIEAKAIEICKYFPWRENYWLEKLKNYSNKSVIFVCGQSHLETFPKRLNQLAIPNQIISSGWGVDTSDRERYAQVKQFIKDNYPDCKPF